MSIFLTGFPGFLGAALLERLLDRTGQIDCLVQPRYYEAATTQAREIAGPNWGESIALHEGDITEPDLGLTAQTWGDLTGRTDELFHLAAVYDLGVEADLAQAVNVDGTDHVLSFAEECPADVRLQYVSTCYVSGRYDGIFGPEDLDVGQSFTNHYEETKFRAEQAVQRASADGLATTIYRPAIVVGDSETGETGKYDGPYGLLRFLLRQPRVAVLPRFFGAASHEVNLVPRDFVVDAIAHLSGLERSANTVYQLCDPHPPTVAQTMRLFARATDRRLLTVPAARRLVERSLREVPGLERLTAVDPDTVPYFTHPTSYISPNTRRALAGTDIACPPLGSYIERLVAYLRANPEGRTDAMV